MYFWNHKDLPFESVDLNEFALLNFFLVIVEYLEY